MKNNLLLISFLMTVLLGEYSCSNIKKDEISLKGIDLTKMNRISIDTLRLFPEKDMSIIMINKHSGIDDFTSNIAFVKSNQYYFQIQNTKKLGYRLSNEYLAYIEDNRIANYGWFAIKNGIIPNKLHNMDYILDSLTLLKLE